MAEKGGGEKSPVGAAGVAAAEARLDRALNRLEASIRTLNGRSRSIARIEAEAQRLATDRARLAADLDRALTRASRLDQTAGDVSRRLVEAMEDVSKVLSGGEDA